MTNNHQILITQEETLSQTIDCLINHIEVNSQGAFTTKDLFNLLVRAAIAILNRLWQNSILIKFGEIKYLTMRKKLK